MQLTDEHSLPRYRVIGSIMNSKEFGHVFKCPAKTKMNPDDKCIIVYYNDPKALKQKYQHSKLNETRNVHKFSGDKLFIPLLKPNNSKLSYT